MKESKSKLEIIVSFINALMISGSIIYAALKISKVLTFIDEALGIISIKP